MSQKIPSSSVEYIKALVVTDVTTASATVEMAFLAPGTEPTNEWVSGSWEAAVTSLANGDFERTAQILVGPGTSWVLSAGTYVAWIKVSVGSEAIVRPFSHITIT